jgi:hypothetical protein
MTMWNWSRSSVAMICARAAPDGDFKACCLESGRYDGANRNDYFQGVRAAAARVGRRMTPRASGGAALRGRGVRRLRNLMTEPLGFLDPFSNCLLGILHCLGSGIPVRHAAWQIWNPCQIPTSLILRKWANFNAIGWN